MPAACQGNGDGVERLWVITYSLFQEAMHTLGTNWKALIVDGSAEAADKTLNGTPGSWGLGLPLPPQPGSARQTASLPGRNEQAGPDR